MPRSTVNPACSASVSNGLTPTPTTTKSASSVAPPPLSVTTCRRARRWIDGGDTTVEHEIDPFLLLKNRRPQRTPMGLRLPCQIVFGEIGPIPRRVLIRADHGEVPRITSPAHNFPRRHTC